MLKYIEKKNIVATTEDTLNVRTALEPPGVLSKHQLGLAAIRILESLL